MSEIVSRTISDQLNKLATVVQSCNEQADLYGLFSYHLLKTTLEFKMDWKVVCDRLWLEHSFDERVVYHIASLGYSLETIDLGEEPRKRFVQAIELLKQRDPFRGNHLAYPFQPVTLLGIALGIQSIPDLSWKQATTEWLISLIAEREKYAEIYGFHQLLYSYIQHKLTGKIVQVKDITQYSNIEELSLLEYSIRRNIIQIYVVQENYLGKIRKEILYQLVRVRIEDITADKAPVIWAAVNDSIIIDVDNLLISPHFVSVILQRFEDAMRRWRYDSDKPKVPVRWAIKEEREVQDIMWLILRSYFDDLVDEDALPKFGHSFYKPDFAIPTLQLLIEAKVVYEKEDFKKIEKEIMQDSVGYLINTKEYNKIIVFIYDKTASVQEHGTTRNALMKIDNIEDVIIVSKPSQIPE